MLSITDQNNLYVVITAYIGEDESIKSWKNAFNEQTITVVEEMISANTQCNAAMKDLIVKLTSIGKIPIRGRWLKRVLTILAKGLKSTTFDTPACRNVIKNNFKQLIMSSCV